MKTLSQPMRLGDLGRGDHFYFASQVRQNAINQTVVEWEFHGELRPGRYLISQVEQNRPHGELPKSDKAGDVMVVRIGW